MIAGGAVTIPGLAALVLLASGCGHSAVGQSGSIAVHIASHPHAPGQPTKDGRMLSVVEGFAGRVYFGYGDGTRNTGPVVISSYEPGARRWEDHLTARSELFSRFRILGGELWAPATDPKGRIDLGFARGDQSGVWRTHALRLPNGSTGRSGPIHIYDAAGLGGTGERFLAGAFYPSDAGSPVATAGIAHFTAGQGWTMSLSVPGNGTEVVRFYNLAELDGRLYTVLGGLRRTARHFIADYDLGERSYVYDGGRWRRGPRLDGFIKPVRFGDVLVFRTEDRGMRSFDGEVVRDLGLGRAVDHTVTDGALVVLSGRTVRSTRDLKAWRLVGSVPADARAVGVLDGVCYLGTAQGEVYRLPLISNSESVRDSGPRARDHA